MIQEYTYNEPASRSAVIEGSGPIKLLKQHSLAKGTPGKAGEKGGSILGGKRNNNEEKKSSSPRRDQGQPRRGENGGEENPRDDRSVAEGSLEDAMNTLMGRWYKKNLPGGEDEVHRPSLPLHLFDDTSLECLGEEKDIVNRGMLEGEEEASLEAVGLWREEEGNPGAYL